MDLVLPRINGCKVTCNDVGDDDGGDDGGDDDCVNHDDDDE